MRESEFYIGYLPKAPAELGRWLLRVVLVLNAIGLVIAFALVLGQMPFPASTFEFGQYHHFAGIYTTDPYPSLLDMQGVRHLLVAPGKHGFPILASAGGKGAKVYGSRIYRDGHQMIEALPDSLMVGEAGTSADMPVWTDLGPVSFAGEIVDTKCYLGVMNPGEGKVHRACAVRCISGGIPPGFAVKDRNGRSAVLLLTGSDGRRLNRELLNVVGTAVRIEGRLERAGDTFVLRTEPDRVRRLGR